MLKGAGSPKPATASRLEEVPLPPLKLASDMFGLFAYLFVMGYLLPSDPAPDLVAERDTLPAS